MIPIQGIRAYLDQPRDDHRWLKGLSHAALDERLNGFDPRPRPYPGLGLHQKVGLYLGIKYHSFALWFDMGSGKTLTALELLQYWWDLYELRRALIFVISDKAFPTWLRQIEQYQIKIPYIALDDETLAERWREFERFRDGLVLLTYPGAVNMLSERSAGRYDLIEERLAHLCEGVDGLVMDESTRVANSESLSYQVCWEVAQRARFRYALAGRPFGRDPKLLWAQHMLVDKGETLGRTYGIFRETFYTAEEAYRGKDYKFQKSMQPELSRILQHRSITYTAEECIDLPPDRRVIEPVRLPAATRAYYDSVVAQIIAARGDRSAMENAFLRMRQLSSGFLGVKDDETGERFEIEFEENPKLDRHLELLESLPLGRKAVIFYEFTRSGRKLTQALTEMEFSPIWLWSGTKRPGEALATFMEDPKCRVAVVNHKVGAYSLDELKVANYGFFFESPVSPIDREQAERRLIRKGQLHHVFLYDVIVQRTADERILDFHREGADIFNALLRNPALLFDQQQ